MFWRWGITVWRERDTTSSIIRMSIDSTGDVKKVLDFSKKNDNNYSLVSCKELLFGIKKEATKVRLKAFVAFFSKDQRRLQLTLVQKERR